MSGPVERVIVASPLPLGAGRTLAVPAQFVLGGDEHLLVTSWNAKAGVELTIRVRLWKPDGTVLPMVFTHTPNSNRSSHSTIHVLGGGLLLSLAVFASAGAPSLAQTFVNATVILGAEPNALPIATLAQSYVTSAQPVSWPGTPLRQSWEGPGALSLQSSPAHALGLPSILTCPVGARWKVGAGSVSVVTDAGGGNRLVFVQVTTSGVQVTEALAPAVQPPNRGFLYTFSPGLPSVDYSAVAFTEQIGIPDGHILKAGDTITVQAQGITALDDIQALNFRIEEWLEVA
jgi:hypothetical protein